MSTRRACNSISHKNFLDSIQCAGQCSATHRIIALKIQICCLSVWIECLWLSGSPCGMIVSAVSSPDCTFNMSPHILTSWISWLELIQVCIQTTHRSNQSKSLVLGTHSTWYLWFLIVCMVSGSLSRTGKSVLCLEIESFRYREGNKRLLVRVPDWFNSLVWVYWMCLSCPCVVLRQIGVLWCENMSVVRRGIIRFHNVEIAIVFDRRYSS